MLTEEGIGGRVTGDDAVAKMAVAAGVEEDAERAALWLAILQIDWGYLPLVVEGTP